MPVTQKPCHRLGSQVKASVATLCGSGSSAESHAAASDHARRLTHLDGLRGVAITLVVLFHAYVRWPDFLPFGAMFAHTAVVAQGKVGVYLFFMISGYVIFMTLERSKSFGRFMANRWLRLWPAMLAASVLIFVSAGLFNRPQGILAPRDLLPGLTFVEPEWWAAALGSPQGYVEGAFWSLYVEMKFYVVIGLLYFYAGPRAAMLVLVTMFLAPFVVGRFPSVAQHTYDLANILSSWHWGWFAAGAMYYKARTHRWLLIPALAISLVAAAKTEPNLVVGAYAVTALFAVAMLNQYVQALLSAPPLLFLGAISYPLYLIHENAMVSMIGTVGRLLPKLPSVVTPVFPIACVVLVGWTLTVYVEPRLRRGVKAALSSPEPHAL